MGSLLKQLYCRHKDSYEKVFLVADVPDDILMSYCQDLLIYKKCRNCGKTTITIKRNAFAIYR
jgi:hypothetical protein